MTYTTVDESLILQTLSELSSVEIELVDVKPGMHGVLLEQSCNG